jgi:adenylylsulfate kinase
MVDAHPKIAIIPEIGWIPQRYESGDGLTPEGRVTPALVYDLFDKGGLGRFTALPLDNQELQELVKSEKSISYADLISLIFDRYGEKHGKTLVGNKTTEYALSITTLHEIWPHTKFVHIIRDGRNVCLSAINWRRAEKLATVFASWKEDPVSTAALWWEWHVRMARDSGSLLGKGSYYEIRYEDLVKSPEEECRKLCEFLKVPYDGAMVRYHEGKEKSDQNLDAKHNWRPPTAGLRDWRLQMPSRDLIRFEAMSGNLLDELGYTRGADYPDVRDLQYAARLRGHFEGRPLPRSWPGSVEQSEANCKPSSRSNSSFVVWLTGLPGSGKTTIAKEIRSALAVRYLKVEIIDGDEVRKWLSPEAGFSRQDRERHLKRVAYLCKLLSRNGIVVIASLVSPYRSTRDFARQIVPRFVEVYLKCPIETCKSRDPKGLYAKAAKGEIANMTGIQDPYEEPLAPEITIDTDKGTPYDGVRIILEKLKELHYL